MTAYPEPQDDDQDAWEDYEPGERPDLPTFFPEEVEAALWQARQDSTL